MHHGQVKPEISQGLLALKTRVEEAVTLTSQLDETINNAL